MAYEPPGDWLADLVGRYEGRLIIYAQRFVVDLSSARDVVQETFLKLCRTRRGEVTGHEAAWLYTVCRRCALDVRRKEKRMTLMTNETADGFAGLADDPAGLMELRDDASEMMRRVERLPRTQKEAIVLKFTHGLSYKEIAEVMGQSISNVGFLIHVGLKSLRERMVVNELK